MDIGSDGGGIGAHRPWTRCPDCGKSRLYSDTSECCNGYVTRNRIRKEIKEYKAKVIFELQQVQTLLTGLGYRTGIVDDGFSVKLEVYSDRKMKNLND